MKWKKTMNVLLLVVMIVGLGGPQAVKAYEDDEEELQELQMAHDVVNLALGKPYTLETPYPVDSHFKATEQAYSDENGSSLTDGVFGSTSFKDSAYVGRIWQASRTVTIDLGRKASVKEIRLSTLHDLGNGIFFPKGIEFSISVNGKAWRNLGEVENSQPTTTPGPLKQVYTMKDKGTQARYVKVEIPVVSWAFFDEIEVMGNWGSRGAKLIPTPPQPNPNKGYPSQGSAQAAGIKHEVLIYSGEWQYQPSDWISFTKEDFKPYVTYVDGEMKPKDYMFDGFLFIPYAPLLDGANYGPTTGKPTNKGHFVKFLDRLFRDDYELGALNEAVKEAKSTLPDRNYEAKVVITIPYPRLDQSDFGDVDGDGVSENLNVKEVGEQTALTNRLKVTKWYVDEVYKRWQEKGYSDLKLASFYWYNEYIAHQLSELDHELVKQTGEYVRSKGATFQWIPYYFARGWDDWKENGFDSALMQPNYLFHANATVDRLDTIAQAAYENGLGVEIELSDAVLTNEALRGRYYEYLQKGEEFHYKQQSYSAFYQQVKTLWKAARSTNPVEREVYDRTYDYMKGR